MFASSSVVFSLALQGLGILFMSKFDKMQYYQLNCYLYIFREADVSVQQPGKNLDRRKEG